MKRTFIFSDEKSNKFWTIETAGKQFTVTFGKTGTDGQSQTKTFADEAACQKETEKLIREKTKKGYVEQGGSEISEGIETNTKSAVTEPVKSEEKKVKVPVVPSTGKKVTKKMIKEASVAILKNDIETLKTLIEAGVTGNHEHKFALFFEAISSGNRETIRLLIPTLTSFHGFCDNYYDENFAYRLFADKELFFFALESGYDLTKDPAFFADLGCAADLEVAEHILQIVPLSQDDGSAMVSAARHDNIPLIDYLLERNARLDGISADGEPLMQVALFSFYREHLDVIQRLLDKGADINAMNKEGGTPISAFMERVGSYGAVTPEIKALFDKYEDNSRFTKEHAFRAAREAQFHVLEKYLENGDVNVRDENGASLLHHVFQQRKDTYFSKTIEMLLKSGIDVNAKDNNGRNALFYLDLQTLWTISKKISELKERGMDIDCMDNEGVTPIMFHVTQRPLFYSEQNDEYNTKESNNLGRYNALISLACAGANLNLRFPDGKTILHHLPTLPTMHDDEEVAKVIIESGADVNLADEHGRTPLHYFISHEYIVGMDDRLEAYIKEGKANLNAQDKDGNTPLHYMLLNNEPDSTHTLLSHGADPAILNNEGKSVEDIMREKGVWERYKDVLKEFQKAPLETRRMEHIWKPVEIFGEENDEPVKDLQIYGSTMLPTNYDISIFSAGKNRLILSEDLFDDLTCIDTLTGNVIWKQKKCSHSENAFYHSKDNLIYSGQKQRDVVAIDPATGEIVWSVYIANDYRTFSCPFRLYNNTLLIFHSKKSAYAVNKKTKKIQWKVKFGSDLDRRASMIWKNYFIVSTNHKGKGSFNLINIDTGEMERTIELGEKFGQYAAGAIVGNDLWFRRDDIRGSMQLHRYNLETEEMNDVKFNSDLIENPDKAYITSFFRSNGKTYFNIYDGDKSGYYECDENMNIKDKLPSTEGYGWSCITDSAFYYKNRRDHKIVEISLADKTVRQLEMPHFSGSDRVNSDIYVNNGTLFVTQLGGDENQDKQILYAIR